MSKNKPNPAKLAKAPCVSTFGDMLRLVGSGVLEQNLKFPTSEDYQAWIEMRGSRICSGMSLSEFWKLVSTRLPDKSAYVPAVSVWKGKFKTLKQFKAFLKDHPEIRAENPRKNRLEVHAGDWARYWHKHDGTAFEKLDQGAQPPLTPDGEVVVDELFRYQKVLAQKQAEEQAEE